MEEGEVKNVPVPLFVEANWLGRIDPDRVILWRLLAIGWLALLRSLPMCSRGRHGFEPSGLGVA